MVYILTFSATPQKNQGAIQGNMLIGKVIKVCAPIAGSIIVEVWRRNLSKKERKRKFKQCEYNTTIWNMTTLKIYNGAELAANDHVEHFKMTRQQFSPKKRLTGQLSSSSDKSSGSCAFSSGQESKTSSSDNFNGSESMCSLDRDTMDRCMQWLKGLPTKFSAIHVQWTPASENCCNNVSNQHFCHT